FGISFLALPRSRHAEEAREAPASMRAAGWLLAGACVLLGLGAPVVVPVLYQVLSSIGGLAAESAALPAPGLWIGVDPALGRLSPPLLAMLVAFVVITTLVAVRFVHRRPIRHADTW